MAFGGSNLAWHGEEGSDTIDYHAEWKAFALRRNVALFLLYSWLPASFGFFWTSRHHLHLPFLAASLIAVWLGCALAAVWWAGEYRCPRCRRRYGALGHRKGDTNLTRGIFDTVCANCKLRKFEHG